MPVDEVVIRSVALPISIDFGATVVFSITGAMVALRRNYDSVGLFVLAMVCGLGGGLLRDGLFIQAGPPAAMRNAGYMIAVAVGCLAAILFFPHAERLSRPFLILDASGHCRLRRGRGEQMLGSRPHDPGVHLCRRDQRRRQRVDPRCPRAGRAPDL